MPNGLAILPNGDFVVSRDIGSGTGITRIPADDPAHPQTNWAQLDDQNGMAVDPTGTWLYADQTFTPDSAVYKIRIADPSDMSVVATLAGPTPKGLDDLTIDARRRPLRGGERDRRGDPARPGDRRALRDRERAAEPRAR